MPVVEAFQVLAAARAVLPGPTHALPQPIPLSEIRAYLELFGCDDVEAFVRLVQAMDRCWLARTSLRRGRGDPPDTT